MSIYLDHLFCEMYSKHPSHEWSADQEHFWCDGKRTHMRSGDEPQAKKVYRCKRKACGRVIKIMIFQGPDEYCSVDCQKSDRGPMITVPISARKDNGYRQNQSNH